jgi:hypothetical protein
MASAGDGSRGGARRGLGEPAPKGGPRSEHVQKRVQWSRRSGYRDVDG